ncbi:AAA family ATPase [Cupriavidus campinensis]
MNREAKLMKEVVSEAERFRKPEPVRDGVILVNGANLNPEPVRWLWRDWLALAKVHMLAGVPGQGKTTLAMNFAATVTSGGHWPDGSLCEAGNVLVWSGEDDPADTLLPRLLAAGANASRIFFVTGFFVNGNAESFDPSSDIAALQAESARIGDVRLIIVDPIVSAVAGDSHKNAETRRGLQPLVDLAASVDAALVGITHFSKAGQGLDPTQRLIGSVAFSALLRVVMVIYAIAGR